MEFLTKNIDKKHKIYLLILFVFMITATSWLADDAFHGLTMVRNLLNGNGFVYNIGERVNASTCPLFYLIISIFSFVTKEYLLTTIFVCVLFSTITYSIILFKFCQKQWQAFFLTIMFLASTSCSSYLTSGLENSLLFLEEILFVYILLKNEKYSFKNLFLLSFICGCTLITRTDAAVLLFAVTAYCFLFKRDCKISKMILAAILGLQPFLIWSLFSLFYYGFIFPNTYYVKLNTGYSLYNTIYNGCSYTIATFVYDIAVVLFPILMIIILLKQKDNKLKLLGIGMLSKIFYIIYIGGDFMVGRHFVDLYVISIFLFIHFFNQNEVINISKKYNITNNVLLFIGILCIMSSIIFKPITSKLLYPENTFSCADERNVYISVTGLFEILQNKNSNNELLADALEIDNIEDYYKNGDKGIMLDFAMGMIVFHYNKDFYLTDDVGLGDPLLARLPAKSVKKYRTGHMVRDIPEGYKDSIKSNENKIKDKDLAQYYDIIKNITCGELFDKNRIKQIIDLNLGKYDYLIENYLNNTNKI